MVLFPLYYFRIQYTLIYFVIYHTVRFNCVFVTCYESFFGILYFVCFSCSHAKQIPLGYVHSYYTTATWREIYAGEIMPVPDPCHWRVPCDVATKVVGSPSNPKQAGRRPGKRIQSRKYSAKDRVCQRCKQKGHYQGTCSAVLEIIAEVEQVPRVKRPRQPKKCGICGVAGHFRRTCNDPRRFD